MVERTRCIRIDSPPNRKILRRVVRQDGDLVLHGRAHDRLRDRPLRRCALAIPRDLGDLLPALVGQQHRDIVDVEDLQTEAGDLVEQRADVGDASQSLRDLEQHGELLGVSLLAGTIDVAGRLARTRCRLTSRAGRRLTAQRGREPLRCRHQGRAAAGRSCRSLRMGIEPTGVVRGVVRAPAIGPVTAGDSVAVACRHRARSGCRSRATPTGVVVANRSLRRNATFPKVMTSPALRCDSVTLRTVDEGAVARPEVAHLDALLLVRHLRRGGARSSDRRRGCRS